MKVYAVNSITFNEVLSIWEDARDYARDQALSDFASPTLQGVFSTPELAMAAGIKAINADIREQEEEYLKDAGDGGEILPGVLDQHLAGFRWVEDKGQLVDQNHCPLKRRLHNGEEQGNPQYTIYLESPKPESPDDEQGVNDGWRLEGCVVVEEVELDAA